MNPPAPARQFSPRVPPVALLVLLTVTGWLACALWTRLFRILGINDMGQWYLDSYAVLAAMDAARAGLNPSEPNPFDTLMRNHVYSDWWYGMRWLGLTRGANFLVGTAWVGAFALAAWHTVKPRNLRESVWVAALLLSPPVLLAVNRANNDLVIFVLLAGCAMAAADTRWWRQILAVAALVLATGLKFYPVVAALAFLWIRPVRQMPGRLLVALVATAGALASVWSQLGRGRFRIESSLHEIGAPLLGREWGWSDPTSQMVFVVACGLVAAGLAAGRFTVGLSTRGQPRERFAAALGVIVLLACFVAGVSYAYRWIFALWMALWLWRQASGPEESRRARWTFQLGRALLFFCVWCDGLLCLVVNVLLPRMMVPQLDALQVTWRQWTQPLHWLLLMLLAGWLLEAAMATWAEWRRPVPAPGS